MLRSPKQGMPLEAAYLETLAARYGAGLRLVDYRSGTEEARQVINAWVDERTEQRIPELLAEGVLTPATRLALVNAIYLKAPWQMPFASRGDAAGGLHARRRLDGGGAVHGHDIVAPVRIR